MRRCNRLAAALVIPVILLLAPAPSAAADIVLTPRGCQNYAVWSGNLVWASDLGAEQDKARADLVARDEKAPSNIYALMLQNLDALWRTEANWEQVTIAILRDCMYRRGMYTDVGETS